MVSKFKGIRKLRPEQLWWRERVEPAIENLPLGILQLIILTLSLPTGDRIVAAAREQLTWGTVYDPSYVRLRYPGGDVPRTQGVCTDVVVRALRAVGRDLQKRIHEDKRKNPSLYPKGVDRNIDHRRCPNQRVFLRRFGKTLPNDRDWKPGDIVFWKLDNGRDHVGIVTTPPNAIHNLSTTLEEPVLTRWKIVGHFRYP